MTCLVIYFSFLEVLEELVVGLVDLLTLRDEYLLHDLLDHVVFLAKVGMLALLSLVMMLWLLLWLWLLRLRLLFMLLLPFRLLAHVLLVVTL